MIGLFLPLIIIAIILIFGVFSGKLVSAKVLQGNRTNIVFKGYLALLLIISVITLILPVKGAFSGKAVSDAEMKKQLEGNNHIYELVQKGMVDEIDDISVKKKWEFPFDEKEVTVDGANPNYDGFQVFVENVSSLEGKIEVRHYTAKSYIENVDITDRITSPNIKLDGAKVTLLPAESVELKFAKLSMPFPFGQFSGKETDGTTYFEGMAHGSEFLYIRVPEGIKVNGAVERIN